MSTQPIDYAALAKQAGAISSQGGIDYGALAKQAGAISSTPAGVTTPPQPTASMSAYQSGIAHPIHWLQDVEADIKHGGGLTWPGRVLQKMGAPGIDTGASGPGAPPGQGQGPPMGSPGELIASRLIGPPKMLRGALQIAHGGLHDVTAPESELQQNWINPEVRQGANALLEGGFQTLVGPSTLGKMLATTPGALLRYGALQQGLQKGAAAAGASPETAELMGNVGTLGAGAAEHAAGGPEQALARTGQVIQRGGRAVVETGRQIAGIANPEVLSAEQSATKALKPRNSKVNWSQEVQSALPDVRRSADNLGLDVNTATMADAERATTQAKKDVWNEFEQNFTKPNEQATVDTSPVAATIRGTVSQRTLEQNPGLARRIDRIASTYDGRNLSIADLEDRIEELNRETRGIEARYPADKAAAKDLPENAPTFAERNALKNLLISKLDELEGPGAQDLRTRYGALSSFQDVLQRRKTVYERQNPEGLIEQTGRLIGLAQMAKGGIKIATGSPLTGAADVVAGATVRAAARAGQRMNDSQFLLRQALRKTTARPAMVPRVSGEYVTEPEQQTPAPKAPPSSPLVRAAIAGQAPTALPGEVAETPPPPVLERNPILQRVRASTMPPVAPEKGAGDISAQTPQATPAGAIYRDKLGNPTPHATLSAGLSDRGPGPHATFTLEAGSDAPSLTFPYTSTDVSHIVKQLDDLGWDAKVRTDMGENPRLDLTHRPTQAALDLQSAPAKNVAANGQSTFVKFGKIPAGGRSYNGADQIYEDGVSVFRAKRLGGHTVIFPSTDQEVGSLLGMRDRPLYEVTGDEVGRGSDGEPLLRNVKATKINDVVSFAPAGTSPSSESTPAPAKGAVQLPKSAIPKAPPAEVAPPAAPEAKAAPSKTKVAKKPEGEQGRPFAAPESSTTYGKQNKIVSEAEANQARANLQDKLFRSSAGLDPTMLADAAKLGAYHLEAGLREFGAWSQKMVEDLGEKIKPHLEKLWAQIQPDNSPSAPMWYSKAAKVVNEKIGGAGSGDQILSTLRNAGVKEDEIKWMGLDDFLKGKTKVSKAELQQFVKDNQIQLEETSMGQRTPEQAQTLNLAKLKREEALHTFRSIAWKEIQRTMGFNETKASEAAQILGNEIVTGSLSSGEILTPYFRTVKGGPSQALQEAGRDLFNYNQDYRAVKKDTVIPTKFENYTLPGEKSNYTEMLLKLPQKETARPALLTELPEGYDAIHDSHQPEGSQWGVTPPGQASARPWAGRHATPEAAMDAALKQLNANRFYEWEGSKDKGAFKGAHFDEPNILAHVRFDDRIGPDGKPTLFVEEVQSDWHQVGKKRGYLQSAEDQKALEREAAPYLDQYYAKGKGDMSDADWKALGDKVEDYGRRLNAGVSGVPQAPFKSDWHELALKRILRYAAENGYDRMAWTTGEQQAARYDLAKQVDKVEYNPQEKALNAYKDGDRIVNKRGIEPSDLAEYIGKAPADKLLQQPLKPRSPGGNDLVHTIDSENLKIGGDWAKALYDRAIPNFLNKYAKKWGGKVGDINIGAGAEDKRVIDTILRQDFHTDWGAATDAQRQEAMDIQDGKNARTPTTVHSLDITPAMKKSVLKEGQPISELRKPLEQPQEVSA